MKKKFVLMIALTSFFASNLNAQSCCTPDEDCDPTECCPSDPDCCDSTEKEEKASIRNVKVESITAQGLSPIILTAKKALAIKDERLVMAVK